MRTFIIALFASVLFAVGLTTPVYAANQVIYYPMENPDPNDLNNMSRDFRTSMGALMLNAFGENLASSGLFANCSVVPSSGLTVVVEPANASQLCSLYQIQQVSASSTPQSLPSGVTGNQLPPNTTLIVVDGLQATVSSSIGTLTAPGSAGQSKYYLIESQLQVGLLDALTRLWVDGSGNPFSPTPTPYLTLADQIVYQFKGGTAGTSPSPPSPDSGWIPVANVLIAHGDTSISPTAISLISPFLGFAAISGPGSGGTTYYANQTIAPNCTATVSGDCGSAGGWGLQSSNWTGSSATTNTWRIKSTSDDLLAFNYNGGSVEFSVDQNGSIINQGNINTVGSAVFGGSITASGGTISGNHVTSGDLSASLPVCTNGGSNITTSSCNIATVAGGTLAGNVMLCTNSGGNLAACSPGNYPANSVVNYTVGGGGCANLTMCGKTALPNEYGQCWVRNGHGGGSGQGMVIASIDIDTDAGTVSVQWFNATGSTITGGTVLDGRYTCGGPSASE